MPDRIDRTARSVGGFDSGDRSERLNQAIDLVVSGQAASIRDDPDLQSLLHLAGRLHAELPRDLPDPAFRADLKAQLTQPLPIPLPPRRQQPTRFPYLAAVGAIAAVLVAAISVGSLGIWLGDDGGNEPRGIDASIVSGSLLQPRTAAATTTVFDTGSLTSPGTSTADGSSDQRQTAAVTLTATAPQPQATASAAVTSTSRPAYGGASIPPVNATTIDTGLGTMADGGGEGPSDDVTFVLDTELPDLGATAPVYWFAPLDPTVLIDSLVESLGLSGEVVTTETLGKRNYHIEDATGRTLHCVAESGAFIYAAPDDASGGAIDAATAIEAARDWLTLIGYPVERLSSTAEAAELGDGQWVVELVFDALPQPGLGHPIGINLLVNREGAVTGASGYWLETTAAEEVALISVEQAWQALTSGGGYWRDGGMSADGGEFRVDQIHVSWMLTVNATDELILQPVVELSGEFITADGRASGRVSVFVQAIAQAS
jgi:hypothetical protein